MTRRPHARGGALLLAALSFALAFLALEVLVRLRFHDEVDTETLRRRDAPPLGAVVEPIGDPELLYDLRPGLRTRFAGAPVAIAPERYRVSARAPSGPGEIRVAVLGDSTAFGWGVAYEHSYPERFRHRMEELAGRTVELRNFAVPGYNAAQELRAFTTKVAGWRPHLLVVHHDHNDADPAAKPVGARYMPPEYGDNPLGSALVKWSRRRLRRWRHEREEAIAANGHRRVGRYIAAGPLYEAQLAARRALVERARAVGAPALIVLFNAVVMRHDAWEQGEIYTELHQKLEARLAEMGYRVLDLYPLYQAALAERGWPDLRPWWRDTRPIDAHPNVAGHAFIAERLVERVLADAELAATFGLLPAAAVR